MDAKTQKIVEGLILDNNVKPRKEGALQIVISARLTKTGAIVVFQDGRKLELFKLNKKQKELKAAIRKELAEKEKKAQAKADALAAKKKKEAAHARAMAKAKKGKKK